MGRLKSMGVIMVEREEVNLLSGLMPGNIRKHATCAVSRLVCMSNFARTLGRRIRFQFTSAPMADIFARGSQLGEAKASKEEADTFYIYN
jgi:hypothetical protein